MRRHHDGDDDDDDYDYDDDYKEANLNAKWKHYLLFLRYSNLLSKLMLCVSTQN